MALSHVLSGVTSGRATSGAKRNEGPNPRLATIVRAIEREGVTIRRDIVVSTLFDQLTAGIPAVTARPDLRIDDFGV